MYISAGLRGRMAKVKTYWGSENIPVISCPHCGESYLTAETLHQIERIKLNRKSLAVVRDVEVASFGN